MWLAQKFAVYFEYRKRSYVSVYQSFAKNIIKNCDYDHKWLRDKTDKLKPQPRQIIQTSVCLFDEWANFVLFLLFS